MNENVGDPCHPNRRHFLAAGLSGAVVAAARPANASSATRQDPSFELSELTIADLQEAMRSGRFSALAN